MERSDWLIQKVEGCGQNHTPPKSGTGIVWADKRRCDWSDKNDVIDAGIYSGLRLFFKKWMETDKYVTLTSETHNNRDFKDLTIRQRRRRRELEKSGSRFVV